MSDTVYTYPSLFLTFHFLLLSVCKPCFSDFGFKKGMLFLS
jgi:hypothetical protein